jgi:hypothetical protein
MTQPTRFDELTPLQQLQVRAATDAALRARITADPRATLAEFGLEVPDDIRLRVVQVPTSLQAEQVPHPVVDPDEQLLLLPYVDGDTEMSEGDLEQATGGFPPLVVGALAVLYAGLVGWGIYEGATNR